MPTSFWQRWFPEDRETVRQRYLDKQKPNSQHASFTTPIPPSTTSKTLVPPSTPPSHPAVELASSPTQEVTDSAARLGVTALYLATLRQDVGLVTKLLQHPRTALQCTRQCIPNNKSVLPFAVRRLPQLPSTPLELAIAMDNVEIVRLLMDHGVTLRIPHQLSLDQLAARSAVACNDEQKSVSYELGPSVGEDQLGAVPSGVDDASITHHPSARGGTLATPSRKSLTTSSSLSVSRGRGQLAALDDLGLGDAFLHDEDVQCTLNWREYEAALLIHANVTIVEALLRRQGYQLMSLQSNPHALAQLFEHAVAAGNAYVVQDMVQRGVDVNTPTFQRVQLPLCVAVNNLQVDMVDQLLTLRAHVYNTDAQNALYKTPPTTTSHPTTPPSTTPAPLWFPLPNACRMVATVLERHHFPDVAHTPITQDDTLQRAARCVEVLVNKGGACGGVEMVRLLEGEVPLRMADDAQRHRATTLLLQILHAQSWSPETHVLFPSAFKDAVRMRLLCRGPCEEDAHQEGATHHHAAASVVVCIEDACCQANPSEIEQQQVAWMFARASKEDMMATADMVWPISQWLGPSGKHV